MGVTRSSGQLSHFPGEKVETQRGSRLKDSMEETGRSQRAGKRAISPLAWINHFLWKLKPLLSSMRISGVLFVCFSNVLEIFPASRKEVSNWLGKFYSTKELRKMILKFSHLILR